jgi:hypothetical protein
MGWTAVTKHKGPMEIFLNALVKLFTYIRADKFCLNLKLTMLLKYVDI